MLVLSNYYSSREIPNGLGFLLLKLGLATWFVIGKDAKSRGCSKQSEIKELFIEVCCHMGIFSRLGC